VVAQLLISHGADVNMADANAATPLMVAAEKSPRIKDPGHLVKLLLDHGAKPELKDSQGRTAFDLASESKNAAALALLK
jgi:ankyrin repeat protein